MSPFVRVTAKTQRSGPWRDSRQWDSGSQPGGRGRSQQGPGSPASDGSCQRAWGSAVCGLTGASKEWIWGEGGKLGDGPQGDHGHQEIAGKRGSVSQYHLVPVMYLAL